MVASRELRSAPTRVIMAADSNKLKATVSDISRGYPQFPLDSLLLVITVSAFPGDLSCMSQLKEYCVFSSRNSCNCSYVTNRRVYEERLLTFELSRYLVFKVPCHPAYTLLTYLITYLLHGAESFLRN